MMTGFWPVIQEGYWNFGNCWKHSHSVRWQLGSWWNPTAACPKRESPWSDLSGYQSARYEWFWVFGSAWETPRIGANQSLYILSFHHPQRSKRSPPLWSGSFDRRKTTHNREIESDCLPALALPMESGSLSLWISYPTTGRSITRILRIRCTALQHLSSYLPKISSL